MDASVIIVNWNTREVLRKCIESIFVGSKGTSFEVIVVDNASSDGSAEMVRSQFQQVILVSNCDNRGFAAANNQGMEIAKGRYILLLNSDTVVLDGAIQKTIAFAEQHAEAAVVGCRVLNPDRTLQPTCFKFPSLLNLFLSSTYLYKIFPRSHFFGRERMTWWNRDDVREVDVVTGCFMLVRREAIEEVGGMDEEYFMYGEETDWCWRFRKKGWRVLFMPNAEIIHLGGQSSKQARPEMILQLRGSLLLFFKKHRRYISYCTACFLVAVFFGLRLPYWCCKAAFDRNGGKHSKQTLKAYVRGMGSMLKGWSALCVRKHVS